MKVTFSVISYFLAQFHLLKKMSKKRKFLLGFVLTLCVRSSRVNADLFAEGFMLPKSCQSPPQCPNHDPFRVRTPPKTTNVDGKGDPYYDSGLNYRFEKKQLQKKFKHAKNFGILGDYNTAKRDLFQRKLVEHMRSTHARLGTYRGNEVYHYFNPDTKLNVMVNPKTNKFISGWLLEGEQLENMIRGGSL